MAKIKRAKYLSNAWRPIPSLAWRRKLDYTKIYKWNILLAKISRSTVYTSPKNLRTWVGIEPSHSNLRGDALPVELPTPWEQDGGEEGYTSANSWRPSPLHKLLLWNTPGWWYCHLGVPVLIFSSVMGTKNTMHLSPIQVLQLMIINFGELIGPDG